MASATALLRSPKPLHPPSSSPLGLLPSSTPWHRFSLLPFSTHHPKTPSISTTPKSSNFRNGSTQPGTECPVPLDQLPINEYRNLSTSFPFSWASGDPIEYSSRLFATGLCFALLVGLPVSWFGSVGSDHDSVKLVLGSVSSGLVAVTLAVVRMYMGWAYVGNRLLSATVEYEETGWYDGQIWIKTAEVLARDRLLGSFQVKPVLGRLKNSLIALAIWLFLCAVLFINYEGSEEESLRSSTATGDRVIAGVYNDESARTFEPEAFCGDSGLVAE